MHNINMLNQKEIDSVTGGFSWENLCITSGSILGAFLAGMVVQKPIDRNPNNADVMLLGTPLVITTFMTVYGFCGWVAYRLNC